jgi:hypothetical protein
MTQQLLIIAGNTFKESIRQPIYIAILLVALLALAINPTLAAYTLDDDNKLLIDVGLSTLLLAGLFLAAFTAAAALGCELDDKTALTVLSKPVTRPLFILGKFLGVAAAMAIAYSTLAAVFLLTLRHGVLQTATDPFDAPVLSLGFIALLSSALLSGLGNYLYRWVFNSTLALSLAISIPLAWLAVLAIDRDWHSQPITTEFIKNDHLWGQLILAMLLNYHSLLILTAIATAAATRLDRIMTLAVCTAAFLFGLAADSLSSSSTHNNPLIQTLQRAIPNLQLLWVSDALSQGRLISFHYLAIATVYTSLYVTFTLALAIALFQRRDLG